MSNSEYTFGDLMSTINPTNPGEKHIACVLLVDTSGSMNVKPEAQISVKKPIDELNNALEVFCETLRNDPKARGCADVCVVSFNDSVKQVTSFSPAANFSVPTLTAYGMTAMNEAIITGLDLIEERKQLYHKLGINYYRPWLFLMTDGYATDDKHMNDAKKRIQEAVKRKKIILFPMAIGKNANETALKEYNNGGMILKADNTNFAAAFEWLSNSLSDISNSKGEDKITLRPLPEFITLDI